MHVSDSACLIVGNLTPLRGRIPGPGSAAQVPIAEHRGDTKRSDRSIVVHDIANRRATYRGKLIHKFSRTHPAVVSPQAFTLPDCSGK